MKAKKVSRKGDEAIRGAIERITGRTNACPRRGKGQPLGGGGFSRSEGWDDEGWTDIYACVAPWSSDYDDWAERA